MQSLSKRQMIDIIEGRSSADRVPMLYHLWVSPETFGEQASLARQLLDHAPMDVQQIFIAMPEVFDPPADDPTFCWVKKPNAYADQAVGLDARIAIEDWDELPRVLDEFPSPDYPGLFPKSIPNTGKYRLLHWWYWLFERLWSLRGMENALTDFYTNPDEIHALFDRLTDFYCRILERAVAEVGVDGVFLSDDIGTQNGGFFSPEIFKTFFKPYYHRFIQKAHSLGIHVWLHSCGDIHLYLPDLIEIGLDVIHPIQKHTMDEIAIAEEFGSKLCILAGFEVQQIIPFGTPDEAREEVRRLVDAYARSDGRFMLTFGNGITPDCPVESLRAVLDESLVYGAIKIQNLK